MSKIDMLRILINRRLTAAAEEIFTVFGRTIAEYEEELSRSKLEIDRQRRLLNLSRKPQISLPGLVGTAIAEQQQWSSSSGQNQEEPLCIKMEEEGEEEDVWSEHQDERSEQNNVNFVLFPSSTARQQQDNSLRTSSVPIQDQDDSELEPLPGPSVQQTCTDLGVDEPGACEVTEENSHFDCDGLEAPPPELEDSYVCTICGRAFAQRSQWAKHVQVHRKAVSKVDKSFKCDICGKRLTRFDGYQKHLRVHTGEKPYCCGMCGRRFSDNSNYKRHIRKHLGPKSQS